MKRALKVLIALTFAVLPLALLAAGLGVVWLARSLPPAAGTIQMAGMSGPVTIARDANGVPHISGTARNDVFAALGVAHAQDRLWQMEVARMAAQGRLSEMFGSTTLNTDIFLRSVAIYDASVASLEALAEDDRVALQRYADGVNAWLQRDNRFFASRLPVEFVALGHQPEPWTPADSVAVVKMMSVGLAANIGDEINRLAFARQDLNPEEIAELMPLVPGLDAPALPDLIDLLELRDAAPLREADLRPQPFGLIEHGGMTGEGASNNWVVSGQRTDTGLPILANDPHLGLSAPSVWYLAHLRVDGADDEAAQNLVGATLAGAPLVLLGRNDNVAWGFTNTGTDVQDLFIEQVRPGEPDRYRTPDGWALFGSREETIVISGAEPHHFTRLSTRHGPVLPPSYRNLDRLLPADHVAALQWTALARDDTTISVGLALWDFATVSDFQAGMEGFVTPMQSIVVADRQGDIGLIAPGRVPVRHPDNLVMGRAPVPGWDAIYDWQGFVDFEALPREINPQVGAIGTANTRIVGDDYPEMLTLDWDEPYRQQRVDALIVDAEDQHTVELSRAAQADVYSPVFAELMPMMLSMAQSEGEGDPFVLALLADWDFQMARERPEPLIAMAWLREATRAIFADDLGSAFDGWFQAHGLVMANVLGGNTRRDWCNDVGTEARETCAAIVRQALDSALSDIERRYGDDRSAWRWGEAHRAVSVHQPFGQVSPLNRIFNVEVESGGGPFTLDRGRTVFSNEDDPFANRHASSYRAIYDLADLDASTFMITTGQSGNIFSRHYSDLAEPWSDVEGLRIDTNPTKYEPSVEGAWQIIP
ncbi:penicillin acylase family protein [Georhizobium sp. MAB10]|uniref:penicillin acylase family protein n=1 Tax=Georhizobium sp. MAB10 TaxID=3028319 RepID=UPI003855FFB3